MGCGKRFIKFLACQVNVIPVTLAVEGDIEGDYRDWQCLEDRCGNIAGCIGYDLNAHSSLSFKANDYQRMFNLIVNT